MNTSANKNSKHNGLILCIKQQFNTRNLVQESQLEIENLIHEFH